MDFHTLARRDLQFLCKKNRIPANITNIAMATALQALEAVEGIEEIQDAFGIHSPKKAEARSPQPSRAGRRSSSSRAASEKELKIQQQASPLPRCRRITAKSAAFMEDNSKEEEDEGKKNQEETRMDLAKTPAAELTLRKIAKGYEFLSTRRREDKVPTSPITRRRSVISGEAKEGKAFSAMTRRSTRLSSRKQMEGAIKMAVLAAEDSEEQVKLEENQDHVDSNLLQMKECESNNEEDEHQGSSSSALDRKNSSVVVLGSPEEEDHGDDSKGEEKECVEQEIVDCCRLEESPVRGLVSSGEIRSPAKKDAENCPHPDFAMKDSIILSEAISADSEILDVADDKNLPSLHREGKISGDVSGGLDEDKETKSYRFFTRLTLDDAEDVKEEDVYCSDPVAAAGIPIELEESVTSPPPAIDGGVLQDAIFPSEVSIAKAEFVDEDPALEKDDCYSDTIDEIPKEPEESVTTLSPFMVARESVEEFNKVEDCYSDPIAARIPKELEEPVTSLTPVTDAVAPQDDIFASKISNAEFVDEAPMTEKDDCCSNAIESEIPTESVTALCPAMVAGESAEELNNDEDCCSDPILAGIPKELEESVITQPPGIDSGVPGDAIVGSEISKFAAEFIEARPVTEEDNCSDIIAADFPKETDESIAGPMPEIIAEESAEEFNGEDNCCSDPIASGIPEELEESVTSSPPMIDAGVAQDAIFASEISNAEAEFIDEAPMTEKDDSCSDVIDGRIPTESEEFVTALSPTIVAGESTEELNNEEDCCSDPVPPGIPNELEESVITQPPAIEAGVPRDAIVDSAISKAAAEFIEEAPVTEDTIADDIPKETDGSGAGTLPTIVAEESAGELNEEDDCCSDPIAVGIPKELMKSSATLPPAIDTGVSQDAIVASEISNVSECPVIENDDSSSDNIADEIPKENEESITPPPLAMVTEEFTDAPPEPEVPQDVSLTTQEAKEEDAGIATTSSDAAAMKIEEENKNPKNVKRENLLKGANLEDLSMRKLMATYKKKLNDRNKKTLSSKPKLEEDIDCLSWSSKFKQKKIQHGSSNKSERKRPALKDLN